MIDIKLEYWSIGVLECWSVGKAEGGMVIGADVWWIVGLAKSAPTAAVGGIVRLRSVCEVLPDGQWGMPAATAVRRKRLDFIEVLKLEWL